jgi:hypothetical protein
LFILLPFFCIDRLFAGSQQIKIKKNSRLDSPEHWFYLYFFFSLKFRGVIDIYDDGSYVLGEGEAIWLLKLVLPYLNECLLKIRALFSGDPATTMKVSSLI